MQTIAQKTEQLLFLKNLQHELQTQENDGQAAPRFWSILNYRTVPAHPGSHDRVSLFFSNACKSISPDDYVKQLLEEEAEDGDAQEAIEELKEQWTRSFLDEDELLAWIHEHQTEDVELVYEKEESFVAPDVMFLTREEAKTHLEKNHYHYHQKAHTYAMTAWRAPKVEQLLTILATFDWDSLLPLEEAMEEIDEIEDDDAHGVLCIYISHDVFLEAIQMDAFASFILPLEGQHETIESVVEEVKKLEHVMYSNDMEEFDAEAFIRLLKKHDISYWTEIQ